MNLFSLLNLNSNIWIDLKPDGKFVRFNLVLRLLPVRENRMSRFYTAREAKRLFFLLFFVGGRAWPGFLEVLDRLG